MEEPNLQTSIKDTKIAKKRGRKQTKFPICNFTDIIKPHRFINPYRYHKVNSFVILGEEDRSVFFTLEFINTGKTVTHIELNTPFEDAMTVYLADNHNIPTVPYEYLVARLKSYGDVDAYDWAQIIERYNDDYKKDLNTVVTRSTPCDAIIKKDENIRDWLLERPCSWFNFKYTADDLQLTSITFSNSLLKALKYSLSKFFKVCFEEGIPKVFKVSEDAPKLSGKYIFKKLFFPNFNRVDYSKPCEIYDAFGSLVPAYETKGSVCNLMEDGSIEAIHYVKFDVKTEGPSDGKSKIEENPEFMKYMQNNSKILSDFLKKSEYTETRLNEEELYQSKVCKVRELGNEESEDAYKKLHTSERG